VSRRQAATAATTETAAATNRPAVAPGLLLAGARTVRGLSRPQLARALGWPTARLADREEGREALNADQLAAAARLLRMESWALRFLEEYFRGGGRLPQGNRLDANWEAFVVALEAGQAVHRLLEMLLRAAAQPAAGAPAWPGPRS
jgi:DNA-binding transcriptional regulator YiaG